MTCRDASSADWYCPEMFDERRIRKHGVQAEAMVLAMNEHSHVSTNDYRRYDYVLEVRPMGEGPFQVEMHHTFAIMESKPQQYDVIRVKFDAASHQTIFDLGGDPRYDLQAMQQRTAELRRQVAEQRGTIPPTQQ